MAALKEFYFSEYEDRVPEEPLKHSLVVEFIWQMLAICTVALGARYLIWRWLYSLNTEVLWLAILVVLAETCAFIGLLLYVHNLWSVNDTLQTEAPLKRSEIMDCSDDATPISVDIFLPTYNEDPELTRYSIRDAKAVCYPCALDLQIHVLDDGNRPEMKKVALDEGVNYIRRTTNAGYKAGNLRNGMAQTHGDFIVILDSDTRPFPTILSHTLGYFETRMLPGFKRRNGFMIYHWGGLWIGSGAGNMGASVVISPNPCSGLSARLLSGAILLSAMQSFSMM